MNVLLLSEYFKPYDFGGSEWSTYYLAKGLSKKGFKITILTPKYGRAQTNENVDNFKVIRFPFYKKIKNGKQLSPFWQTNIIWLLWTSFYTIKYCLKNQADLIHIQGKYFLPAAIVVKFLLGKKVIVTLRDYILLCPMGMCFLEGDKACNLPNYFLSDLRKYLSIYMQGANRYRILIQILASIRARLVSYLLRLLLMFVDSKIVLSNLEKDIYERSGVEKMTVIANPIDTGHLLKSWRKNKRVVFAGRLTPGKGPDMLLESIPTILEKYPEVSFYFFGEGFLKPRLIAKAKSLKISHKIKFAGRIDHQLLLNFISSSAVTAVPSIWPEPFGRVALESLAMSTPVVVTTRTGIAQSIKNERWGKVVDPTSESIAHGIIYVLDNFQTLQQKIKKDKSEIQNRWGAQVYNSYAKIYRKVIVQ